MNAISTFRSFHLIAIILWMISPNASSSEPYVEIYDERATHILNPNTEINLLGTGFVWAEGPVWVTSEKFLLFTDVPSNKIYKYRPGEEVSLYLTPSGGTGLFESDSKEGANGLLVNEHNRLVLMQHGDRRVSLMNSDITSPSSEFTSLASNFEGARFNSPNDGVFHSNGDLYFTDPPYGLADGRDDKHKQLEYDGIFRVTATGEVILEDNSFNYPNGIALSNNEKTLYVAASDPKAARIYAYDVNRNGSINNKRVFYDATSLVGLPDEKGLPDGMVVHSDGYIFATGPGGVFVFTESGDVLAKIRTGKATANCTLSADEKTLYMTAHDTLMSISLK